MKTILGLLILLAAFATDAAVPALSDFNANQFATNGGKVAIKSGALLTNTAFVGSLTLNGGAFTNGGGGSDSYSFDTTQFTVTAQTNVTIKSGATVTNLTIPAVTSKLLGTDGSGVVGAVSLTGAITTSAGGLATTLASGVDAAKIADGSVSSTEFQYLGNVTSDLQTQINSKAASDNWFANGTTNSQLVGIGTANALVATNSVGIGVGSATALTLYFNGDTDTGFYSPTANAIGIVRNNIVTVAIDNFFALINTSPYCWSSGNPATQAADTFMYRNGAGEVSVRGASSASGSLLASRSISTKTGNYVVVVLDSRKVFTNSGAGGEVDFTLPTWAAGLEYTFDVETAQTLKVIAPGSDTIRIAGSVSGAGGNITNATIGGAVTIVATISGKWVAINHEGTWTVN